MTLGLEHSLAFIGRTRTATERLLISLAASFTNFRSSTVLLRSSLGFRALDEGVSKATFEKHSGVSDFRSSDEAAPKRRAADLGVLGMLRWTFCPELRYTDEGVERGFANKFRELGSFVADRIDALLRSVAAEVRNSRDDLLAEKTGRGVRIGVSFEDEARLSEDLFWRLCTFGVFRADIFYGCFAISLKFKITRNKLNTNTEREQIRYVMH